MRRACNVFIQVVLGPSLIYFFLLGHVAYQIYKDPDELKTQAWPAHTTKAEKEAIIKGRKPLINGILDLAAAKNPDFAKKFCTDDIDFEDPIQRVKGLAEVDSMVKFLHRVIKHGEVEVHEEHHSAHEIVLVWTVTIQHHVMSSVKMPMYLRSHVLLEPPATKGGPEKVFRMFDEWGGNPLMTERNTWPSWLGKTHSKLRLFHGYLMTKLFDLYR